MNRTPIARLRRQSTSAIQFVNDMMTQPVEWPDKAVRWTRDSARDEATRLSNANPSVAELYHLNSMLFAEMVDTLAATRVDEREVRRQFLVRRDSAWADMHLRFEDDDTHRGSELCRRITRHLGEDFFYAIELRIALAGRVLFHEPRSGRLYPILSDGATLDKVRTATSLIRPVTAPGTDCSWCLVVVASLARNSLMLGDRGYRRCLIDTGRVAETACAEGDRLGLDAHPVFEFDDRALDDLNELDGVEESVLAVIEIREAGRDERAR